MRNLSKKELKTYNNSLDSLYMPIFEVTFYNQFLKRNESIKVEAKNSFRAGRVFYKTYDRKKYGASIKTISKLSLFS